MSTNVQLPVVVEQERIPRRRIFTGVSSGKVTRYSAVRRASVKRLSFSSPLANFTPSTGAVELGQDEHGRAVAGCGGAGKDSAAEDFYGGIVGEGDAVFGGAEGVGEAFEFFVAAGELYAFHGGG